jgi:hypothetical protein
MDGQSLETQVRHKISDEFVLLAVAPRRNALSGRLAVEFRQGRTAGSLLCGILTYGSTGILIEFDTLQ